mmetsp:Transcript_54767/g.124728  ORF Transcript_54767/g.124728 Transcript_54767/m.124728 type:complete len:97 (+) Transcript_54767:204-494(+)
MPPRRLPRPSRDRREPPGPHHQNELGSSSCEEGEMLAAERKRNKMLNDDCRDLENEVVKLQEEAIAAELEENKTARERQRGADEFDVEESNKRSPR